MIEGCIVAKLVLGYLSDEGLHRTCASFQEECSLFHNGNSNLDQVLLTSDLKTILEDYSQLKETGRENGTPTSTAVLKSLWRDLDVVIGRLKYATIATNVPKINTMKSQSTRTRRLNHDLLRRNTIQKNHVARTSSLQQPVTPSNASEKLPLPRLSTVAPSRNQSLLSKNSLTTNPQSSMPTSRARSSVQSAVNNDINTYQTLSKQHPAGVPVAGNIPLPLEIATSGGSVGENEGHITGTPCRHSGAGKSRTYNDQSSYEDAVECMIDIPMDDADFSEAGYSSAQTTPVMVINNESSKDKEVSTAKEGCLSDSNPCQNELHLQSPKRKGVHPRKRVSHGDSSSSLAGSSPVKQVPKPANQELGMDVMRSSDTLTPQSFLGTLLSTPLLQEKLAENINKVVGSSRTQPATDAPLTVSVQTVTTTEASSDDVLTSANQEDGVDVPVKEIIDLMQADPAFDVLFSLFGLDALDALPSTTDPSTMLTETVTDSCQTDKPPASEAQIPDNLEVRESTPNIGNEMATLPSTSRHYTTAESSTVVGVETGALPSASRQHLHTASKANESCKIATLPSASRKQLIPPSSSSASDLHSSAASIVTDALLLLAGSPQKGPSNSSSQLYCYTNDTTSKNPNPATPPKTSPVAQSNAMKSAGLCRQPALITSTFPYVRALDFTLEKEPEKGTRDRKKGSKNKKGTKQKSTSNEQNKAPRTDKKTARKRNKPVAANTPSESTSDLSLCTAEATSGVAQPFMNTLSTSNKTIVPAPPVNVMVRSSNANPSQHCLVNPTTAPAFVPISVIPSPSPVSIASACSDQSSSSVSMATGPASCASDSPGSHASVFTRQSPLPASPGFGINTAPSPVNLACRTPTPVNFTTSAAPVQVSCPLVLGNANAVPTPTPVSLTTSCPPHIPLAANVTSKGSGHVPVPIGFIPVVPGTIPSHQTLNDLTPPQAVNTTASLQAFIPGSLTESTVMTNTAAIADLSACEGDHPAYGISDSVPVAPSETSKNNVSDLPTSEEPFSLKASNMLQTLALQYVNTQTNTTHSHNQESDTESGQRTYHRLQGNLPDSNGDKELQLRPLQEKPPPHGNVNCSRNITEVSRKKDVEGTCSSRGLPHTNPVEPEGKSPVPSVTNRHNKNRTSTSSLATLNQESSEVMKENLSLRGERETQESSTLRPKRPADEFQQQKTKKMKSSCRPSKRSKTKRDGIDFPSNLNVEEFLSKLHYEEK